MDRYGQGLWTGIRQVKEQEEQLHDWSSEQSKKKKHREKQLGVRYMRKSMYTVHQKVTNEAKSYGKKNKQAVSEESKKWAGEGYSRTKF